MSCQARSLCALHAYKHVHTHTHTPVRCSWWATACDTCAQAVHTPCRTSSSGRATSHSYLTQQDVPPKTVLFRSRFRAPSLFGFFPGLSKPAATAQTRAACAARP